MAPVVTTANTSTENQRRLSVLSTLVSPQRRSSITQSHTTTAEDAMAEVRRNYIQTQYLNKKLKMSNTMNYKHISRSVVIFFKWIPYHVRNFFIEALLIPSSRQEWGERYTKWNPTETRGSKFLDQDYDDLRRLRRLDAIRKRREQEQERGLTRQQSKHLISHDHGKCHRIKINVSGRMYETQLRTVERYPLTLLGDPQRRLPFFDPITETYYFDRHRESFEMILYYYQSGGRIRRKDNIGIEIFLSELVFFDLGEEALLQFRKFEGLYKDDEERVLPKNLFQRKIWLLFEYPESSSQSTLVAIISIIAILISITSFCMETIPMFEPNPNVITVENGSEITVKVDAEIDVESPFQEVFNFVEFNCVLWFVLEFVLRTLSSPNKVAFCLNAMNLIDFVAIAPYFVQLFTKASASSNEGPRVEGGSKKQSVNHGTYLALLRVVRLVRVFRIFKLSRHSRGLQILGLTLQASLRELGLLIFFLFIGVILFASAAYTAESGETNSKFISIPHSFYWGIITMTTVGYGDVTPETLTGKIIGAICAISGVLCLALPVPVIVSNFNFFYLQGTSDKTVESMYNNHHVPMCSFLPGNGIHPEANIYTSDSEESEDSACRSPLIESASDDETIKSRMKSEDGAAMEGNNGLVVGDGDFRSMMSIGSGSVAEEADRIERKEKRRAKKRKLRKIQKNKEKGEKRNNIQAFSGSFESTTTGTTIGGLTMVDSAEFSSIPKNKNY